MIPNTLRIPTARTESNAFPLYKVYLSGARWYRSQPNRPARQRRHPWVCALRTLLGLLAFLLLAGLPAAVRAQATSATNPDLTGRCGLDIVLAVDESGSFQGFEAPIRYGVRGLLDLLADTGARVALVEFNLDARAPLGETYLPVTAGTGGTLDAGGAFDLYLNNNYQPQGNTNWEAAFLKIEEINRTQGAAPLVIFLTDGDPNAYISQFGNVSAGDGATSLAEAIPAVNLVKAQGSHIFAVGIGAQPADEAKLIAVSGPDRLPGATLRSGQADYVMTTLSGLETTLRRIAFELCAASLSVIKRENLGDGQGYQLKAGQLFTATVAITENGQPADAYEWLAPVAGAASTVGLSQPLLTNSNGVARWQWAPGSTQSPQPWAASLTLAESPSPNLTVVAATCTRKSLDANGNFSVSTLSILPLPAPLTVTPNDLITCDIRNAGLGVTVRKKASPLVVPESGGDVLFTFEVTNQSATNVRLSALNDTVFGNLHNQGTCVAGGFNVIGAGETYSCTLTKRLAGNAGAPHQNTVTATVVDPNQNSVTAQASATVTFSDAQPAVTLTRSAAPETLNEPGGAVLYTVELTNQNAGEAATLTTLTDTPYGDVTTVGGAIQQTTCVLPRPLAPAGQSGATYRCTFTVQLTGVPGPYTDTLTATLQDDDGNSLTLTKEQLVTIVNTPPAATLNVTPSPAVFPEPGGPVTFAVVVANTSAAEGLTLSELTDSRYGNLTTTGGAISSTTCQLPQTLAPAGQPNARYECTFTTNITGNPGLYPNTVQATVGDDDGGVLQLARESGVEITDLPASLVVTKRAARTSLPEPGGNMTFTVTVANTSQIDHVRIDQVVDDQFGVINGNCQPALPADLAPQQQIRCVFVAPITGVVGQRHINEVTASGVDDDGKPIADRDQEIVEITDLPARLDIIQVADPANLPEPGGDVTFTALIANLSAVDHIRIDQVETNAINEDPFQRSAALAVSCTPALPTTIKPGEQLPCRFTKFFTGPIGARHTSRVTVTGADDDGLPVQQSGYETIEIVDVPAILRVTQSANPVSVPESGGLVELTVQVQNGSSVDSITLQSLTNNQFGDLAAGCATPLPLTLAPGATLTCRADKLIQGDANTSISLHTTAAGMDDDNHPVRDEDTLTIGVTDTPSAIKVVQTTSPTSLQEPGGVMRFTVVVENSSAVDSVTIQRVQDSRFGDIGSSCVPALPATLAPRSQVVCQFSRTLTGEAGTTFASTVSASGVDDDGQAVTDFDLSHLDVMDVPPQVTLAVTAAPNRVLETGGPVTTTVVLVNNGPEALTLERLFDSAGNDLHRRGDCRVPQTLAPGGVYQCVFTANVVGAASTSYQLVVTAEVSDNDGNRVQSADEAEIFLLAVAPDLVLTKRDLLLVDQFTHEQDRGKPSPGDTLGYEITVRNRGNGPATNIVLTDIPDTSTTLVVGSVQSSKGAVIVGNQANQQLVMVDVGEIAAGEQVTISFAVIIREGAGATLLRNQATISQGITGAAVAGSDDPDTPFFGDPTDTIVFIPPTALLPGEEPQRRLFLPLIKQ